MILDKKYKIALIGYRLNGGGAEKQMANLSLFFDSVGIDVHIITVLNDMGYAYAGKVFHTRDHEISTTIFGRISRFWAIKKYFEKEKFDYIIDFRFRNKFIQELLINRLVYKNTPVIYRVESYLIDHYLPKSNFLANIIYKHAFSIVCVSKKIEHLITSNYNLKNTTAIYNGLYLNPELINAKIESPVPYIIAVGSMENTFKQFDHLLKAYAKIKTNQIPLYILGTGSLKADYEQLALQLNLGEKVKFLGFKDNVFDYMKNAKLLVMSSKNEGFPNVLIESLANNTPVVSYDCDSGPSEIIINEYNGLLVENQNIDALASAINRMLSDHELYAFCKANAKSSIEKFEMNAIGQEWIKLLKL